MDSEFPREYDTQEGSTMMADVLQGEEYRISLIYPGYPSRWSPCRLFRYTLYRCWDESLPFVQFVGLNPSTADDEHLDPTVTRCRNYAQAWGYGAFCMTNLFALRATDPRVMKSHESPEGEMNDYWLGSIARQAGLIVCCWGVHGTHRNRAADVLALLGGCKLHLLSKTKGGHPGHPLYLSANRKPVEFNRG
jgi:hypothetical protein